MPAPEKIYMKTVQPRQFKPPRRSYPGEKFYPGDYSFPGVDRPTMKTVPWPSKRDR